MPIQTRVLILPSSRRPLTYELERKAVKNLNLRIRSDGTVHLSIPKATTIAAAEALLCQREEWILGALARMEKRAAARPGAEAVGDSLPYLGGHMTVEWRAGKPCIISAACHAADLIGNSVNNRNTVAQCSIRQRSFQTVNSCENDCQIGTGHGCHLCSKHIVISELQLRHGNRVVFIDDRQNIHGKKRFNTVQCVQMASA